MTERRILFVVASLDAPLNAFVFGVHDSFFA